MKVIYYFPINTVLGKSIWFPWPWINCWLGYQANDRKENVVCVFLDLYKAFDTVNHGILLEKLSLLGLKHRPLQWFTNYLADRYHTVYYNGVELPPLPLQCGLPHGSILGPSLFLLLLHIIDLPNAASKHSKIVLQLISIFYSHKDPIVHKK